MRWGSGRGRPETSASGERRRARWPARSALQTAAPAADAVAARLSGAAQTVRAVTTARRAALSRRLTATMTVVDAQARVGASAFTAALREAGVAETIAIILGLAFVAALVFNAPPISGVIFLMAAALLIADSALSAAAARAPGATPLTARPVATYRALRAFVDPRPDDEPLRFWSGKVLSAARAALVAPFIIAAAAAAAAPRLIAGIGLRRLAPPTARLTPAEPAYAPAALWAGWSLFIIALLCAVDAETRIAWLAAELPWVWHAAPFLTLGGVVFSPSLRARLLRPGAPSQREVWLIAGALSLIAIVLLNWDLERRLTGAPPAPGDAMLARAALLVSGPWPHEIIGQIGHSSFMSGLRYFEIDPMLWTRLHLWVSFGLWLAAAVVLALSTRRAAFSRARARAEIALGRALLSAGELEAARARLEAVEARGAPAAWSGALRAALAARYADERAFVDAIDVSAGAMAGAPPGRAAALERTLDALGPNLDAETREMMRAAHLALVEDPATLFLTTVDGALAEREIRLSDPRRTPPAPADVMRALAVMDAEHRGPIASDPLFLQTPRALDGAPERLLTALERGGPPEFPASAAAELLALALVEERRRRDGVSRDGYVERLGAQIDLRRRTLFKTIDKTVLAAAAAEERVLLSRALNRIDAAADERVRDAAGEWSALVRQARRSAAAAAREAA